MNQDGTLKAVMDELRDKMEFYRKEADKIETALKALQFVAPDGVPGYQPPRIYKEFADASIAEAAAIVINRAQRRLHVREIANALHEGGYPFKAKNPPGSVAPVLFEAAKQSKFGLVNTRKNTYSIKEIEERKTAVKNETLLHEPPDAPITTP